MSDAEIIAQLHAAIARLLAENERLREALRQVHAVMCPRMWRE
jgi:hypothetical protein